MTPERFRQIRNLFEATLERDADARSTFLAEACQGDATLRAEVGRLLAAHGEPEALFDRSPLLSTDSGGGPERMEGRRIDHYEILRELGRGGMGSVYLAVRTDDVYRKPVALKVVRPEARSEEVLQRFRQEREIVAGLDHPNIARLLDGGATPEGLPYFVMDYVEGEPIDAFCDAHHSSIAERLALFQTVCSAVEYAHIHRVVHRDLKPSNILVTTDGVVKLLDFGIAKLLRTGAHETVSITRTGLRLMTPEYASPEQVRGDHIDRATDVYSLGAILYELLTGHRPYRMRSRLIHEVVRVICEEEPTRPSAVINEVEARLGADGEQPIQVTPQSVSRTRQTTAAELGRQLSGEIDAIVLKALRKDPLERYRSAKDFNDDVQRHLDGLPVLAQGPGLIYRAHKLLRRHGALAMAGVLVAAGLATGSIRLNVWAANFLILLVSGVTIMYWIGRLEFGGDIAKQLVAKRLVPITLMLASLLLIAFAIVKAGLVQPVPDRNQPRVGLILLQGPMFLIDAAGLLTAIGLILWPLRRRWAGALLVDLSRRRVPGARVFLGIMTAVMLSYLGMFISMLPHPRLIPLFYFMGFAPYTAYMYALWGRVEIRERGIVGRRGLLRWAKIESYRWEQPGDEVAVVKLRVRSLAPFTFVRTRRIFVPADRQPEADAILGRQFAEWPDASRTR